MSFDSLQVFKEGEHSVTFSSGSFDEGNMVNMTVDKEDMRFMEKDGKESFVALVSKDKYVDVVRYGDTIKKGRVKAEDYRNDPINSISRAEGGQELAAITISKDLEKERSDSSVTTRVPGTGAFGNGSYLQLSMEQVKEVHGGKSYFTYIDMNRMYNLKAKDGSVESTVSGKELLSHYKKKPFFGRGSKNNIQESVAKAFHRKKQSMSYGK